MDGGATLAAVLLGELEAEKPELPAAGEQPPGELARLLPLVDVRCDFLPDEPSHGLAQLLVLVGERRLRRPDTVILDHAHELSGGFQSSIVV